MNPEAAYQQEAERDAARRKLAQRLRDWHHDLMPETTRLHREAADELERLAVAERERDQAHQALREFNAEAVLSLLRPGRLLDWRERFAALAGDGQ